MRTERRAGFACVAALVACVLWIHAPGMAGPNHLTAHHDNLDGTAPLRVEAARQLRAGHLPLWNPWKRAGMPLLADTTAGALYPGNVPFLFLDDDAAAGDSPVFRALDQVAAINAVVGALAMYVFLRTIALAPLASAFGALVFACSGTMGWFAAWYMQIQSSVVWLPLLLAAVQRAADGRMATWTAVGALGVALQFLAGFPETSFYSGVIAIAYAASLAAGRRSWRPIGAVIAIYATGILLSSVQLLPSLELQSISRRPGALPLDVFQSLPASTAMVRWWALPSLTPGFEFPPLGAYHFGMLAAVAAAAGALLSMRRAAFFVGLLVVGFVLSIGAATPVSAWLHHLPPFSAFRHPFKHLFELSFAMAALSAIGAQRALGEERSKLRAAAVVFALASVCVSLRSNQATIAQANMPGVETSGARPQVTAKLDPAWRVLTPRRVFQPRDPEFLIGDYPSQFRVAALHGAGPFLWTPLADAAGMVEEETTFRPGLFEADDRTLPLLSTRYLIQSRAKDRFVPAVDVALWKPVSESAESRIVEREDALPRLRFVGEVRCADANEIEASLHGGGGADPAKVALVDCTLGPKLEGPWQPASASTLRVARDDAGSLVFETNVPDGAKAFLVVSQSDVPGWHAAADGKRVPIRRVHGLVQGIELPAGTRHVEMRYLPITFIVGASMSMATLVILLLWNVVERMPTRSEADD